MTTAVVVEMPGVAPLNLSEAGSWLCGKHETLRELVSDIGAWRDGAPDMAAVRDAVLEFDSRRRSVWPTLPGPNSGSAAFRALSVMAPSEVGRLRMLATLAPRPAFEGPGVEWCADDLASFDRADTELIYDWLRAVRIGIIG